MFSVALLTRRTAITALVGIGLVATGRPAFAAGSATGTLDVELNVTNACIVNGATSVSSTFGSAGKILFADQPGLFGNADAQALTTGGGTIAVTCSPGSAPTLTVGAGANDNGGAHRLANGSSTVAYHLFTDAARTNEIAIGQTIALGTATGSAVAVPIYGRVNSNGQILAAGKYTDTVQLTVAW